MRLTLALPGNEAFADRLALAGGSQRADLEVRLFPDAERYVRIPVDVAGRAVDLVCTLARPDRVFLSLAFAADALRDLGATEVNLIAPYLGYLRQDARFREGEAISSRTFARLTSSLVDRLITVDPHLHRHPSLASIYTIPCVTLQSAPRIAAWIRAEVEAPLIIGPDAESEQWAAAVARQVGAPHVVLAKQRLGDREVRIALPDLGAYRGRKAVLIDDIASSGRTLVAAAEALAVQGFGAPVCVVVHALFAGDALDRVAAAAERVVSTDTIAHSTNGIWLAPLVAEARGGPPA